ncbi:Ig-like domain (group 2) [Salinimicrobium sediminis]|uniref:Ig-like domain (Group 2) n=1 Tax=Salinimicrobium sediminis TaxID=1343891 RepID=A0A285X0A2_9FLAO|nr:DUF4886 domain-containing protein [Salinimicrobium sediminis]SOC78767.1 Ig-like domain (group 2) [Salinimicrobium sediminis]
MKPLTSYSKILYSIFLLLFLASPLLSCSSDDDLQEPKRPLAIDLEFARIKVGQDLVLKPRLDINTLQDYTWEVSDSSVVVVSSVSRSYEATVTAVGEGTATVTVRSEDGAEEASTTIETYMIQETEVELPESITAYTQSKVSIKPKFNLVDVPSRTYTWTADPGDIISFETDPETYEIEIQGLTVGTTELTITSDDGEVVGSTTVTVENENDGVLKILAIGNSFSEDAIEYYLHGLAKAAGEDIVIGNLYIGGAELSQHVANATANAESYSYRKIGVSGNKSTTADVSIASALADENWDYISFQQVSQYSGQYETFVEDLPALYNYVEEQVDNENVKYLLHQTWAYAQNSTHSGFVNYNNDQMTMYEAIVDAYDQAMNLIPAFAVVPSGTAIQNARTSYLGDNFNRDGYHLNEIGRYTAASTWFEVLFSQSVVGNSYTPEAFAPIEIEIAQHAAHEAVESPGEITELTEYQSAGGNGIIEDDVYINFGNSSTTAGWNTLSSFLEDATVPNLTYANNEFTGIELAVESRFNGINTNGEKVTTTDFDMPEGVSGTSFFGNAKAEWAGMLIEKGVLKLTGFEGDQTYEFCFFGSRTATDNRETQYTVIGENTETASLDAASNTDEIACVTGIKANSNGEIIIEVTAGPNNTNNNGFFYLNAMRISPAE